MNIVFMGTPDFAVVDLEHLLETEHTIQAAFCQPDKPRGRDLTPAPPPVKLCATCRNIETLQPRRLGPRSVELLRTLNPDIIVVSAYGKILPPEVLAIPRLGCVNVHASLLPSYRGAAPIQWAIANGESISGVTLMQMNEGLDTGDMLRSVLVPIESHDTASTLHDKLAEAGAHLLIDSLPDLEAGRITPVPQEESKASWAPILSREDGLIDWTASAQSIECRVRGFHPWPGTFTHWKGKVLKVYPAVTVQESREAQPPGRVLAVSETGILVQCGKDAIRLENIQMEGKRRLPAAQFAQGARLSQGELLG